MDLNELEEMFEQLEGLDELRGKINSRKPAFGDDEVREYQRAWDRFVNNYMPKTKPKFVEFMNEVRSAYSSIEQELTKLLLLKSEIKKLELGEKEDGTGPGGNIVGKIYELVKELKCAPSQHITPDCTRLDERLEEIALRLRDYDENISNELEDIASYLKNSKK